ncbi:MAG: glycosyltransferase [Lachnospiraceae bacterium]|nr:glycosyltransferase [Lachnospiraceae bacterium]
MADVRMLSVVVPVYKVEKEYLDECFASILGQTFKDFELIIVDDGADSITADHIDAYDFGGADVSVIHQENAGVASARNRGLDACSGKYVTFIDSDDTIEPECFEDIIGFAEKNSHEVLMFGIYRVRDGRRSEFSPYRGDIDRFDDAMLEEVQYKCMVGILPFYKCPPAGTDAAGSACAKLYRLDFLNENGLRYRSGLKRAEDMEFNLRVFSKARSVGNLGRFYYNYRQLPTSATYVYRPGGAEVFAASLKSMREHLDSIQVSDKFMQVYYMRCMFFLLESMDMDYLSPQNPKPLRIRLRELSEAASAEPFAEAFGALRGDYLTFARKIPLFLIRHRMFAALALFYRAYRMVYRLNE